MNKNNGILQFLKTHSISKPISFHMPGHKGSGLFERMGYDSLLNNVADLDITEITGADNLFQAEGIIKETVEKYIELYNVRKSYLLINGTSGGILASVMASVPKGKKLILARNCHKSVFNAMTLGNIAPVYAYPEFLENQGISGQILPEEIRRLLEMNPDAEAVILPSPNYYGICSNVSEIADIVHEFDKILIVDQAHGAHLKFFEENENQRETEFLESVNSERLVLPVSAETSGADFVINSTHKTLASFTQSAILNVCTDRALELVDILEDKLQQIESTSPSYILMASLDANAEIVRNSGEILFSEWRENIKWFYEKASDIEGLNLMRVPNLDFTKINLDFSEIGISGAELEDLLIDSNIFPELVTGNIVMCMSGIGNTRNDYMKLYDALMEISRNVKSSDSSNAARLDRNVPDNRVWNMRRKISRIGGEKELLEITKCSGRMCASSVIPYPPGIPLVCPGEIISEEDGIYIEDLRRRGEKVIGIDECNRIWVQKDSDSNR